MSDVNEETADVLAPSGETYKLRLEGGGVVVDREVDQAVALQILAAVMGGGVLPRVVSTGVGRAPAVDFPRSGPPRSGLAGLSPREYMEEYEPKRNVDKILALAAYLTDTLGQETFTPDDVKREFRNASEPVPGNYSRDWRWAVTNTWLAKVVGAPGEYYVTSKGRAALAAKFSDEVKKGTGVSKTRRRRATKKAEDTK